VDGIPIVIPKGEGDFAGGVRGKEGGNFISFCITGGLFGDQFDGDCDTFGSGSEISYVGGHSEHASNELAEGLSHCVPINDHDTKGLEEAAQHEEGEDDEAYLQTPRLFGEEPDESQADEDEDNPLKEGLHLGQRKDQVRVFGNELPVDNGDP